MARRVFGVLAVIGILGCLAYDLYMLSEQARDAIEKQQSLDPAYQERLHRWQQDLPNPASDNLNRRAPLR